jgi:putative DNA primase/helicase
MSHIQAFIQAMRDAGITPPVTILDNGKPHRFATKQKHGDKAGMYILHGDAYPAGFFMCHRSGVYETWSHKRPHAEYTQEQRAEWAKRMELLKKQRDDDQNARHNAAAEKALLCGKQQPRPQPPKITPT